MPISFEDWVNGSKARRSVTQVFEKWVQKRGDFKNLDDMVRFQKSAQGDDRYEIADLAVEHVKEKGGTYGSMQARYGTIRSYFIYMRAELPKIQKRFDATKEMVAGKWTIPIFLRLIKSSKLRDQAIYLTLFQGFMDQKRFWIFNKKGFELGEHIKKNGVDVSYRFDFTRGRKGNKKPFNTWIGRDALQAWKDYFESGRGYPKHDEPAAVIDRGKNVIELDPETLISNHRYRLESLGLKTVSRDSGARYGYGLHELRDLGRSLAERAKSEIQGFNDKSAEFWMGHEIDPYDYNKIWKLDPDFNLKQYQIVEKYLNIISHVEHPDIQKVVDQRIAERDTKIRSLEKRLAELEAVYTKKLEIKA